MRHVICKSCLLETRWGMFANPDDLRAKIVEEHFPKSAELSNTIFNIFNLWRRGVACFAFPSEVPHMCCSLGSSWRQVALLAVQEGRHFGKVALFQWHDHDSLHKNL